MILFLNGDCSQRGEIRAGTRFGEALTPDFISAQDFGQVPPFLFFVSEVSALVGTRYFSIPNAGYLLCISLELCGVVFAQSGHLLRLNRPFGMYRENRLIAAEI